MVVILLVDMWGDDMRDEWMNFFKSVKQFANLLNEHLNSFLSHYIILEQIVKLSEKKNNTSL